jgi:hypothetical protein
MLESSRNRPVSYHPLVIFRRRLPPTENKMLFILYYLVAIVVLVMHFTGILARYNVEWLVLVLAVTVFPAVIYL